MIHKRKDQNSQGKPAKRRMPFIGKRDDPVSGGKRFVSMRVKFVGILVVTGVSVLVAALVAIPLFLQVFRNIYMKPENVDDRLDRFVGRFASYVAEETIRSDDTKAVVRWTRLHRSVYLTVFNDDDPNFGAAEGKLWPDGSTPDMKPFFDPIMPSDGSWGFESDESSKVYAVLFSDGLHPVAVVDYSMSLATDIIVVGGVLLAIFVFFMVIMVYYHLQTRDIVALSREVEAVSSGALDARIMSERNDEIGRLANDVNTMRNTILEKMEEKEKAWQANSDLLTSMTHDIRTPLTALMGYIELLNSDQGTMTEEQREYVRICARKAEQIKGLSDELFLYFWAYNRAETHPNETLESFEARILMEQIIGDYIPAMEAEGLCIQADLTAIHPSFFVRVRIEDLRRVTDNLFDNMRKYADRKAPVRIHATCGKTELTLCFANAIAEKRDDMSSTNIGIKTCMNMMTLMQGRFETSVEENDYVVRLSLPVYDAPQSMENY